MSIKKTYTIDLMRAGAMDMTIRHISARDAVEAEQKALDLLQDPEGWVCIGSDREDDLAGDDDFDALDHDL